MFLKFFVFFCILTVFVAEAGTRPPPKPRPRPRPRPRFTTTTYAPPVGKPADDDPICPHGEPSGGSFLCQSDSTCENGNYCSELGHCCKGPAPAGVRRVHVCPADTTWEGPRPKSCFKAADCGKDATCMGFWVDPTKGRKRRDVMHDQGEVCCKGMRWGRMG